MDAHNTTCTIRFHRATRSRTLATITTAEPGLVRWRRIILPVPPCRVHQIIHALAHALRCLPKPDERHLQGLSAGDELSGGMRRGDS